MVAGPGCALSGRPTTASHPCSTLRTSARLASNVTTGARSAGASTGIVRTPPGTMLICGSSVAAFACHDRMSASAAIEALMRSTFLQYARPQAAVSEPRFNFIAHVNRGDVADECAVRRPGHDGKSACEGRKRTYRIQSALRKIESMLCTRNGRKQRVPQAFGEEFVAHAQVAHQPVRRVAHEARKDLAEVAALAVQFGA